MINLISCLHDWSLDWQMGMVSRNSLISRLHDYLFKFGVSLEYIKDELKAQKWFVNSMNVAFIN